MPLQIGVALIAMYHFIDGIVCFINIFMQDNRLQSGGYNPRTDTLQCYVGAFGIILGLVGLLGVYDKKLALVRVYNAFQGAKLAALAFVYVCDVLTLMRCDSGSDSLRSQAAMHLAQVNHTNPLSNSTSQINYIPGTRTMSTKGLCQMTRLSYALGFAIDFGLNFYFAWVSYRFLRMVELHPMYRIGFAAKEFEDHTQIRTFDPALAGEPSKHFGAATRSSELNLGGGGRGGGDRTATAYYGACG